MLTLIVEDDPGSCKILQRMVEPFGTCDIATDAGAALYAITAALEAGHHYDLICLDMQLPDGDGHQVLQQLRNLEEKRGLTYQQQCKVLVISVLKDGKTIMQAFRHQCEGYLTKPFDPERLQEQLLALNLLPAAGQTG